MSVFSMRVIALVALLVGAARAPLAQLPDSASAPVAPSGPQRVSGRIVEPHGEELRPIGHVWVTLHRVGRDHAGPLDSVLVGADGRFTFHYRRTGDPNAVYFTSVMYQGIAYPGDPLHSADVRGEDAQIIVYDTTSDASGVHVQGRHMVVSAPRAGERREIIEVYELSNDSARTVVARDSTHPVWTTAIPDAATNFRVAPGDVPPGAVAAKGGRLALYAPISPGLRQLTFSYQLPDDAFPLTVPMLHRVEVLELLVEDPLATVSGAGLVEQQPAQVEGRVFKRFLAQGVPPNAVARITLGTHPTSRRGLLLAVAIAIAGALVLLLVGRTVLRRRRLPANAPEAVPRMAAPSVDVSRRDALILQIAALDEKHERRCAANTADDAWRGEYTRQRERLKRELGELLAAGREAR